MGEKQFVVLSDAEHSAAWGRLDELVDFTPNSDPNAEERPFVFHTDVRHETYDLAWMIGKGRQALWRGFEETMLEICRRLCPEGSYLIALDWQHSSFHMWPQREPPNEEFEEVPYENAPVGTLGWMSYRAYYPSFYPDGDYHFFLAQDYTWGFLGHPWRKEMCVFGEKALREFEAAYGVYRKYK